MKVNGIKGSPLRSSASAARGEASVPCAAGPSTPSGPPAADGSSRQALAPSSASCVKLPTRRSSSPKRACARRRRSVETMRSAVGARRRTLGCPLERHARHATAKAREAEEHAALAALLQLFEEQGELSRPARPERVAEL